MRQSVQNGQLLYRRSRHGAEKNEHLAPFGDDRRKALDPAHDASIAGVAFAKTAYEPARALGYQFPPSINHIKLSPREGLLGASWFILSARGMSLPPARIDERGRPWRASHTPLVQPYSTEARGSSPTWGYSPLHRWSIFGR